MDELPYEPIPKIIMQSAVIGKPYEEEIAEDEVIQR